MHMFGMNAECKKSTSKLHNMWLFYTTFWKRQMYRNGEQVASCQGLGVGESRYLVPDLREQVFSLWSGMTLPEDFHRLLLSSGSSLVFSSSLRGFFFNFYFILLNFYFILLYNTVLVLPYIDMNQPRVYMSSQSWAPLRPLTPYHLSGSSACTSPKHPVSCIEHRLAIHSLHDSIHVSMPFSQIIPPSPSPSCPKVRSIHLHLFCCLA